jgi:putative phosphoribosyl transferase
VVQDRFRDRADAGRALARKLEGYRGAPSLVVLALPRGGVPVGFEVAHALVAPLDAFVVRKLGAPDQPELAIGAIASGGVQVLNDHVVAALHLDEEAVARIVASEEREFARREQLYRGGRMPLDVSGCTVILVDDGLATGATMRAGALALRARDPALLVLAVPVASAQTCDQLRGYADEVVCALTPEPFVAVGRWYEDFSQTTDDDVRELLDRADALWPR